MKSKLWLLIIESLKQKIKTKVFVISQLLMLIFIVFIMNITAIIQVINKDTTIENVKKNIYVLDDTGVSFTLFEEVFLSNIETNNDIFYKIINIKTLDEGINNVKNSGGLVVNIIPSGMSFVEFNLYSTDQVTGAELQIFNKTANTVKNITKLNSLGIVDEDYNQILENTIINQTKITIDSVSNEKSSGTEWLLSRIFTFVLVPMIVLIAMAMATIGADINEEKATRIMDFLIGNVPSKTHLSAKIITGYIFSIIQAFLVVIDFVAAVLVGLLFKSNINLGVNPLNTIISFISSNPLGNLLFYLIIITIIFIILNLIAFGLIAGVFASLVTTNGEYQQIQLPMVMFLFSNLVISMIFLSFDNLAIAKILAYVPFLSVNLCPCLLLIGEMSILQVIISLLIMAYTNYLLIKYGLRIYRTGVLDYSRGNLFKKIIKALKTKKIAQ